MSLEMVTNRTALEPRRWLEDVPRPNSFYGGLAFCSSGKKMATASLAGQCGWHQNFWTNALDPGTAYISGVTIPGGTAVEFNNAQAAIGASELQDTMKISGTAGPSLVGRVLVGSTEGSLLFGSMEGQPSVLGVATPTQSDCVIVGYNVQAPNVTGGLVGMLFGIPSHNTTLADHTHRADENPQTDSTSHGTEQMAIDSENIRTVAASVFMNMRSLTQRERVYLRKLYKRTDRER